MQSKGDKKTMKQLKKTISASLSLFLIACTPSTPQQVASTTTPSQAPQQTTSQAPITTQENELTMDECLEIALQNAGVSKESANITKSEIDMDHGVKKYEFEFYYNNTEYDYEINAVTGEIISKSTENHGGSTSTTTSAPLTQEDCFQIALQHANVKAEDIGFNKVELDYERGREVYDFEFYVGNVEYNYTVDSNTGEILEYEIGD